MVRQELVEGHLDPRTINEELEGRQLWQYHRILSFASSYPIVFIFQLLYFLHICIFSFLVFNHLMEILVPKSLIFFYIPWPSFIYRYWLWGTVQDFDYSLKLFRGTIFCISELVLAYLSMHFTRTYFSYFDCLLGLLWKRI